MVEELGQDTVGGAGDGAIAKQAMDCRDHRIVGHRRCGGISRVSTEVRFSRVTDMDGCRRSRCVVDLFDPSLGVFIER